MHDDARAISIDQFHRQSLARALSVRRVHRPWQRHGPLVQLAVIPNHNSPFCPRQPHLLYLLTYTQQQQHRVCWLNDAWLRWNLDPRLSLQSGSPAAIGWNFKLSYPPDFRPLALSSTKSGCTPRRQRRYYVEGQTPAKTRPISHHTPTCEAMHVCTRRKPSCIVLSWITMRCWPSTDRC